VQHTPGTLVGHRTVQVAVLDHDRTRLDGWPHLGRDVVGAIGRVDERLGARGDVPAAVQHDLPQLKPEVSAPWLAAAHDLPPLLLEPRGEQLRLCRLARTVAALKGDEEAGCHYSAFFLGAAFFAVVAFFACAFFAGAFLAGFFAGPLARLSASSCTARSKSISSTVSPRGMVALVTPSVTYAPKRPSLILIGLPLSGSSANSLSALEALRAPYFGCANSSTAPARSMSKIWSSAVSDRVSVPFFRYGP